MLPVYDNTDESMPEEMILLGGPGSSVTLGTSDPAAKASERPVMKVTLGYNFYLAKHETTCGEYFDVMSRAGYSPSSCDGDSLPITDVTFYDAVLFANEQSKANGRDTAYSYSKASFDSKLCGCSQWKQYGTSRCEGRKL